MLVFQVGNNQLVWSKTDKLWEMIGDFTTTYILYNTLDIDMYIITTYYFYSCLQLIVHRLLVEEFLAMSCTTMSLLFATFPKND